MKEREKLSVHWIFLPLPSSLDLKDDYDRAKALQDKAVETSTHNYVKRKGVNAEVKQFKEQKSEAEKFEQLREDRVSHCSEQVASSSSRD